MSVSREGAAGGKEERGRAVAGGSGERRLRVRRVWMRLGKEPRRASSGLGKSVLHMGAAVPANESVR